MKATNTSYAYQADDYNVGLVIIAVGALAITGVYQIGSIIMSNISMIASYLATFGLGAGAVIFGLGGMVR